MPICDLARKGQSEYFLPRLVIHRIMYLDASVQFG